MQNKEILLFGRRCDILIYQGDTLYEKDFNSLSLSCTHNWSCFCRSLKPKKSHPLFSYYAVYVSEKTGLYQIRAISDSVTCNKYGAEIQNAFNSVKDRIAKSYGKPRIIDKVDSNSSFKENNYWFYSLQQGARQLSAIWGEKTSLADNLETVALDCVADTDFLSYEKAHLVLYYYFSNAKSVEDEQDDVF